MSSKGHTKRAPRAFISYARSSARIQKWVHKLASRLREDGVDVYLDRWALQPGDDLGAFMFKAIAENEFVLVVCTPGYLRKAHEDQGGVGFESQLMMNDMRINQPVGKYIAILRQGTPRTAIPLWLGGTLWIDLRRIEGGLDYAEVDYQTLLNKLHSRMTPPKLGKYRDKTAMPADAVKLPDGALVKLVCPVDGDLVGRFTECRAVTKGVPIEYDRWIVVFGPGGSLWYPNRINKAGEEWTVKTIVGSVDCAGADFQVGLFVTNERGSDYLNSRLHGVSVLPPGILDAVTVTRI